MILLIFSLSLAVQSLCDASVESPDSVTCKETALVGNTSKLTAECWIRTSATVIPCLANWDTLHLEIFSEEGQNDVALRPTLFNHCGHLRVLAIWEGGPLSKLQRDIFQPLFNLQRLVIRAGNLRSIEKNFLLFLPNLNLLSITDSKSFKRLGMNTLEPLPSQLTTLDLSNNQLMDVLQPGIFGNHPLRNLYLQNNKITGLYEESLLGLSELRLLRISGNHLSGSLETALGINSPSAVSALASVPQLEILDLANNYLTEITGCRWSVGCEEQPLLTKLRVLNLAKNRLTWLDPDSFRGLPGLAELRLEGNTDLFQAGSLPVVLFSLTRTNYPELKHLAIPQEPPGNGLIELCLKDKLQTGSRIILSAMEHLTKHFCEEAVTKSVAIEEAFIQRINNLTVTSDIPDNEGPIFAFIRRTHRWVLATIAIGLLLSGILISAIIFTCFHCGLRRSPPGGQEDFKETAEPTHSRMSLHHVYTPEGLRQVYLPLVQPLQNGKRFNELMRVNGSPQLKSHDLARRRNASNSVYSLLSAPPAVTSAMALSMANLISPQTGVKRAVV
ncbi:hypothetical protein Aperf_G00000125354 [Anoplocephala perfoliata]